MSIRAFLSTKAGLLGLAAVSVSVAVTSQTSLLSSVTGTPFNDELPDWAKDAIVELHQKNIVQGYDDGRFGPSDPVTRGQVMTMLYRVLRQTSLLDATPKKCQQYFDDVNEAHYAHTPLCALMQKRLLDSAFNFDPDVRAPRGVTAKLISRVMGETLKDALKLSESAIQKGAAFSDIDSTSGNAHDIAMMNVTGIMTGYPDGRFGAADTLNRAQAAVIMSRLVRKISEKHIEEIVDVNSVAEREDESENEEQSSSSESRRSSPRSTTSARTQETSSSVSDSNQSSTSIESEETSSENAIQEQSSSVAAATVEEPVHAAASSTANLGAPPRDDRVDYRVTHVYVSDLQNTARGPGYTFTAEYLNNGVDDPANVQLIIRLNERNDASWELSNVQVVAHPRVQEYMTQSWTRAELNWNPIVGTHKVEVCAQTDMPDRKPIDNCANVIFTHGTTAAASSAGAAGTADLDVTSIDVRPPVVAFQPYVIAYSVMNRGTAKAEPSNVQVSIDVRKDGSWDVVNMRDLVAIDRNNTASVTVNQFPWNAVAGTHKLRVCANVTGTPYRTIIDNAPANNCREKEFTVLVPTPDFTVSGFSAPSGLRVGQTSFSFPYTLKNISSVAGAVTRVQLTIDSGTPNARFLSKVQGAIPAQGTVTGSWRAGSDVPVIERLSWTPTAGTHHAKMCINSGEAGFNAQTEIVTDNNCREITFTVQGDTINIQDLPTIRLNPGF